MEQRWCNLDLGPSVIDSLLKEKKNQNPKTVDTTGMKTCLSFPQIDDQTLNSFNYFIHLFTVPKTWKKEHTNLKEHQNGNSSYFLCSSSISEL